MLYFICFSWYLFVSVLVEDFLSDRKLKEWMFGRFKPTAEHLISQSSYECMFLGSEIVKVVSKDVQVRRKGQEKKVRQVSSFATIAAR